MKGKAMAVVGLIVVSLTLLAYRSGRLQLLGQAINGTVKVNRG